MSHLRTAVFYFLLLIFCSGCAGGKVTLYTLEPAAVSLKKRIKRVAIINESQIPSRPPALSGIEKAVDARDAHLVAQGREAAISALYAELRKDGRFDTVCLLDAPGIPLVRADSPRGNGSWESMKNLCGEYGVDALFSLAFYDTDTKVNIRKSTMEQADLMRVRTRVPAREITLETIMANGWYIYDPFNREVIDAVIFEDEATASGTGTDALMALESAGNRKDTLLSRSRDAGSRLGLRLKPSVHKATRSYYVRGADELTRGASQARSGDWDGAFVLWEQGLRHSRDNVKGKYCHNLAVYYEYMGDLASALEWATAANSHLGNGKSFEYMALLGHRVEQYDLVKDQLAFDAFEE